MRIVILFRLITAFLLLKGNLLTAQISQKQNFTTPFLVECSYDEFNIVKHNNKMGIANKSSKIIFLKFDEIPCDESLQTKSMIRARLKKKWGYINSKGKIVIPFRYDATSGFSEDLENPAVVIIENKYGYIDKTGKTVIPVIYDAAAEFQDGFATVLYHKKWGMIDTKGEIIVPFIYDKIGPYFTNGKIEVTLDNKLFFIDKPQH